MAVIIPISCKNGIVILASQHVYGEEWGANLTIDNDEYKHYEMTPDVQSITWAQVLTSFATGEGTGRAKFDNTPGADLPVSKGVWLDGTGTGYLGYSALVGFVIGYTIIGVRPSSNTGSPGSNMFEFNFKITACTFTSTGP